MNKVWTQYLCTHLVSQKFYLVEYQHQGIGHSIYLTQWQMCLLVIVYLVFNHSQMLQSNLEISRAPGKLSSKNINDNKTQKYFPASVVNILPRFTPQTQNQPTFGNWWTLISDYARIWCRLACCMRQRGGVSLEFSDGLIRFVANQGNFYLALSLSNLSTGEWITSLILTQNHAERHGCTLLHESLVLIFHLYDLVNHVTNQIVYLQHRSIL